MAYQKQWKQENGVVSLNTEGKKTKQNKNYIL